jgi:hypothetical protein
MLATTEATTAAAIATAADRPDEIAGAPAAINDSRRFVITRVADAAIRDHTSGQQDRTQPNREANGTPAQR